MTPAQARVLAALRDGARLTNFGAVMGSSLITRSMLGFVETSTRVAQTTLNVLMRHGHIEGTPSEYGWITYTLTPTGRAALLAHEALA
jgi:predicted DNA-binding transcriptional regulator